MATMNPYYFCDSDVGPVYDVAHFSPFKAVQMGLVALILSALIGVAAAYVWNPDWFIRNPSKVWADAHQDIKDLKREHPRGTMIGVAVAGLCSAFCAVGALSCLANAVSRNYYIRVGEEGVSLRLPDGFFAAFELDVPWSQVKKLQVVQIKQLGSLSQSAGNVGGKLQLATKDGLNRCFMLDDFREDAWLIYKRIQEAMDLQPAALA